jgi:hypothetical protein
MFRTRVVVTFLIAVACTAIGAAVVFGPSSATGAARVKEVWKGQPVASIQEAKQVAHAGAADSLTIADLPTAIVPIDVGEEGDSPGDYFVLNLRLFDEKGEAVIGRGSVQCTLGVNSQTCRATIRIYHRGQIIVDGTMYPSGTVQALAVVGGTGEFKGVGGVVRVMESPDLQVLVFHLTR